MTPEQFFTKNMKWIALILFVLFLFKSVQSCSRGMSTSMSEKEYNHTIDSLQNKIATDNAAIEKLKFELKLQSKTAEEADKRATAVQSVAEKIRANTTVNVRGAERDTLKKR